MPPTPLKAGDYIAHGAHFWLSGLTMLVFRGTIQYDCSLRDDMIRACA